MPRSGPGPRTARPSTRTAPEVGATKPAMMWRSVLFPQPLGPTMLTNWLSPTARSMSWIASTVSPLIAWKVLVRCWTSILAMSPRQVRVIHVRSDLKMLVEEAELGEPRQRVLQLLRGDPGVEPPEHVLVGEVELLEDGLGHFEL